MLTVTKVKRQTFPTSEYGETLRRWRIKAGYSQDEVSQKLGYAQKGFLSICERGISGLPFKKWPELAKLYNVPLQKFIDLELKRRRKAYEMHFTRTGEL